MTVPLAGKRALVIEDEGMLRLQLADFLEEMGCIVAGTAANLAAAETLAATAVADFALLDLNLNGQVSYGVAEILRRRGIPFLFSTGYRSDAVAEPFRNVPMLPKPFDANDLEVALARVFTPPSG